MRTLSASSVRTVDRQFTGPQPATVLRSTGGRLFVELDAIRGLEIEVKWSRPSSTVTPPKGTRCLVLFAGGGVADAWVVAFSSWPA